jgi:predicted double-glycine peptidase
VIQTQTHNHNLPGRDYVKVYYTDGYTILEKRFSDLSSAKPFINILKVNANFHFIQLRAVSEEDIKT